MAVFRVEKTKDFTIMCNHHLRNTELSLKAKGLLSLMLSLPEDWDYTTKGLAKICKDGIDSICSTINELEQAGYIIRERIRNEKGQLTTIEYSILEEPQQALPKRENPVLDKPVQEKPILEKSAQLNNNILNTKKLNTDLLNTYPIQSHQKEPEKAEKRKSERIGYDEITAYRSVIQENIEYDVLTVKLHQDIAMLDEIVNLLTETVCTTKEYLTVASDTYPSNVVKAKLLKLNAEHIEYVMDCMKSNATSVRNIKKYLLAVLFNALSTMGSYYTALVAHDMATGQI
mgnify:FL=1